MSNTRITAERLAEIESATRYESGNRNPVVQAVYKELLAELREVMRERDEAREKGSIKAMVELHKSKYLDTVKLSTALEQELADLNAKAGNEYAIVTHYKAEMERLAAEVERLEKMVSTNIMHVEIGALRAELTRRQLVKDEDDETIASLRDRVAQLEQALELIAAPKRKDGTYNRSREACEQLARAALNPVKAGTSVCRHSVPTDRKCLDCAVLNASPDGEKGKGV